MQVAKHSPLCRASRLEVRFSQIARDQVCYLEHSKGGIWSLQGLLQITETPPGRVTLQSILCFLHAISRGRRRHLEGAMSMVNHAGAG